MTEDLDNLALICETDNTDSLAVTEQYIGKIGKNAISETTSGVTQENDKPQEMGYKTGWYQIDKDYDPGIAVRSGPSAKEECLIRIPNGTAFYVDEVSDVWGHTDVSGYTGWIHLDYTKAIDPPENQKEIGWYRIISDYDAGIAVRSGPSAKEELLTRIPQGTEFYVDATNDVWGHTTINGYTGWIHLNYAERF